MFYTNDPWPISMKAAIARTGLGLKYMKVFAFLRKIGAFSASNLPDDALLENGYFTYNRERYANNRHFTSPRIASPEGFEWFKTKMQENISEVS